METPVNAEASRAGSLPLIGRDLALDFANTSSGRGTPTHCEHLLRAEHVIAWARHARVLTAADSESVLRKLSRDQRSARKFLTSAVTLRDLVYSIATAIAAEREPEQDLVRRLTRIHGRCIARARLLPMAGGFVWAWDASEAPLEATLGPIALSALTLLTQVEFSRIRQCEGDACGWLFFDTTKNKSRRWCEMEVCGNRARQRRFHARRRAKAS